MVRRIGFHLSAAGGVHSAIERASELGINSLQLFLKNSNRWSAPQYSTEDITLFRERWRVYPDLTISAHTGYLINPAAEGENLIKSKNLLDDELKRAAQLGIKHLVLHPGSRKEKTLEEGISSIALMIDEVISENSSDVIILLETTAGQGSSVGHRFEHIRDIIGGSNFQDRLGVCIDTCHIFAAGYDISDEEGYNRTMEDFGRIIGFEKLKMFHLNDSKKICGSKVDRHEHIGRGEIGADAFRFLLNDKRFFDMEFILETPDDEICSDRENLEFVKSLLR